MTRPKPYVGKRRADDKVETFRSDTTPTAETHPQYRIVYGPFTTVRGAHEWVAIYNAGYMTTQDAAEESAQAKAVARAPHPTGGYAHYGCRCVGCR